VYIINWYKTASATESQDNIKQWNRLSKSEKWLDLRLHRRSVDDTLHVEEAMEMSRIKTTEAGYSQLYWRGPCLDPLKRGP